MIYLIMKPELLRKKNIQDSTREICESLGLISVLKQWPCGHLAPQIPMHVRALKTISKVLSLMHPFLTLSSDVLLLPWFSFLFKYSLIYFQIRSCIVFMEIYWCMNIFCAYLLGETHPSRVNKNIKKTYCLWLNPWFLTSNACSFLNIGR